MTKRRTKADISWAPFTRLGKSAHRLRPARSIQPRKTTDEDAPFGRDRIAQTMTAEEIAQSEELAERCVQSGYLDC